MAVLVAAVWLAPARLDACWTSQTIPLKAGWNAVHIKVNPFDASCDAVFGGGGVEQATWWNRDRRDDGTRSVSADMYSWYRDNVEARTFRSVLGDERYLVKAVAATNLVVTGTPAIPRGRIHLGEMNLLGLNVPDAVGGISYQNHFGFFLNLADSAFYEVPVGAQNGVYVEPGASIQNASQALWVQTKGSGAATYTGAFTLSLDTGDKILAWGESAAPRTINIRNATATNQTIKIELEASLNPPEGQGVKAGAVALKMETIDYSGGWPRRVYTPVVFPFTTNIAAGATLALKLRPDLDAMPPVGVGDYLGVLKVSDAGSTYTDAGVGVKTFANGTTMARVGVKVAGSLAQAEDPYGLWVGNVALTGVNRAKMLSRASSEWDAEAIQDTTQAFQFRLIVHSGSDGKVRLLKEAFIGTNTSDNDTPYIMTDRETAKSYREKHPRDGTIRRVSSANFPFQPPKEFTNPSAFRNSGAMTVTFTQLFDAKDNPFVHQFHPNHDNLAFNNGAPRKREDGASGTGDYESWSVTRTVTLEFLDEDPTGANEEWNRTVCGGIYTERITGLNKTPIITQGAFRLNRRLSTPALSTGPGSVN